MLRHLLLPGAQEVRVCLRDPCLPQDRLDPIDWATYEPYLWAHVKRYYSRTATLFGFLVQLQRVHAEGGTAASSAGSSRTAAGVAVAPAGSGPQPEFNPLNILPMAPRFQYLPISTPAHNLASAAGSKGRLSAVSLPRLQSGR